MKTPKKPITKKPSGNKEELDDDYEDIQKEQIKDEDDDDFDLPLDDLEPFESFDDDDDDF